MGIARFFRLDLSRRFLVLGYAAGIAAGLAAFLVGLGTQDTNVELLVFGSAIVLGLYSRRLTRRLSMTIRDEVIRGAITAYGWPILTLYVVGIVLLVLRL
jgi:hypothetical protein